MGRINSETTRIIAALSLVLTIMTLFFFSCVKDKGVLPEVRENEVNCDSVKYSKDVQPIFNTYCITCHFSGNPQNIVDLSNYATASVKAAEIKRRAYIVRDMPQAGSPKPTDEEREKIKCWVDNGAPNN